MLSIADIRDYIASLCVAADSNCYCGKLPDKKDKSIGVYGRKSDGAPLTALGGNGCLTYGIKPVSLLVHWNRSIREAEKAAYNLYEKLRDAQDVSIKGIRIDYIRLMVSEPQDVGTDDKGVFEYVIWADFYYEERKRGD